MKTSSVILAAALAGSSLPMLAHADDSVAAWFSDNPAVAGQSVTFYWQASSPTARCNVEGLPSSYPIHGRGSGNRTFTANQPITVNVSCWGYDGRFSDTTVDTQATLQILPPGPPVVTAAFSPSSVKVDNVTTLTWNAQYANSCSSPDISGVSGTSGSVSILATKSMKAKVVCTGPGGTGEATADLKVNGPYIEVWTTPSYLSGPGYVTVNWRIHNVDSCTNGTPLNGPSPTPTWINATQQVWVGCTHGDIAASASAWVNVGN